MSMKGRLLGLMAIASAMGSMGMGGGGMFDSPSRGNRWNNLPDVPKGSGEPNFAGFFEALAKHEKHFEGKKEFEVNGLHLSGLSQKHVNKRFKQIAAEHNIPQDITVEVLFEEMDKLGLISE